MTDYLVYSLQTEQRANVSTNTCVVQITYRPTRSAVEQRLTRPTSMHHCFLAADGQTGAAAHSLSSAIKNTKGIISVVQ